MRCHGQTERQSEDRRWGVGNVPGAAMGRAVVLLEMLRLILHFAHLCADQQELPPVLQARGQGRLGARLPVGFTFQPSPFPCQYMPLGWRPAL